MKNNNNLKVILCPEKMEIDLNGIKNFYWPIKNNYVEKFKKNLLNKLESKLTKKKDAEIISLNLLYVVTDLTNIFIAKKLSYYLLKSNKSIKKTENNLVDEILMNKKISLPRYSKIILNGLKKKNIFVYLLKRIKNIFFNNHFKYIVKKDICDEDIITFSSNFLIEKSLSYIPNGSKIRTSNFQNWLPSGKINLINNTKKSRKISLELNKTVISFIKEYGLSLSKREKEYIYEIINFWINISEFFLKKISQNKKYFPKKLWIGTAGNFYNRIFAYIVKKNGGNISGFDHGVGSGLIKSQTQNLIDYSVVDNFYTFSIKMEKALKNKFTKNFFNKKFKRKNILNVKSNTLNLIKKINFKIKPEKILYVSRIYTGDRFVMGFEYYHPDIVYVDWQIRLFSLLKTFNFKTYIKSHPQSYSNLPNNLSNNFDVKFCKKEFEEEMHKFDLIIFDTIQTSCFLTAIKTNIPIVFLNIKELDLTEDAFFSIKKRCGYVDCKIKNNNRIITNKNDLFLAMKAATKINKDESLYKYFFN